MPTLRDSRGESAGGAPCAGRGASLGPALIQHDTAPVLCLPCLALRPGATTGERLRALRYAAGLTRDRLARKAGVTNSALGYIERGVSRPRPAAAAVGRPRRSARGSGAGATGRARAEEGGAAAEGRGGGAARAAGAEEEGQAQEVNQPPRRAP